MGKTIRISDAIYEKVKANKKQTSVPIVAFVEKAIEEKLENQKNGK